MYHRDRTKEGGGLIAYFFQINSIEEIEIA